MRTHSVIYPGTFDPITNGHVDLTERAARPAFPYPRFSPSFLPLVFSSFPLFPSSLRLSFLPPSSLQLYIPSSFLPFAFFFFSKVTWVSVLLLLLLVVVIVVIVVVRGVIVVVVVVVVGVLWKL